MYFEKKLVYSQAGKYLKKGKHYAYQFALNEDVIEEYDLDLSDLTIEGKFAFFNNRLFAQKIGKNWTYGDYKKDIIKKRYSNDDQIAIILNKDDSEEDLLRYKRMLEWREFASKFAKLIMEKLNG